MSKPNSINEGKEDTGSAPESGDPKEQGRNRGQVVGGAEGRDAKDQSEGTGRHLEEGRHESTPRTGS
jgi:hypothetical protein